MSIEKLKDIDIQDIKNMIKFIQNKIDIKVNDSEITFWEKDDTTIYYKIKDKTEGMVKLYPNELMLSAGDVKLKFPMFTGIEKSLYFYFKMDFSPNVIKAVVQKNKKTVSTQKIPSEMVQMIATIDINNNIQEISYFQYMSDYDGGETHLIIERKDCMDIENENILALMYYYKFLNPENYKTLFEDVVGPTLYQPNLEEIKQCIDILHAMEY